MCFLFALLADAPAWAVVMKLDNAGCLACHDGKKAKIEVPGKNDEKRTLRHVDTRKFGKSVHADMQCVACHTDISDNRAKHVKAKDSTPPNCINCHENLWEAAKNQKQTNKKGRLGVVVQNIKDYKSSFHARPDEDNPDKAKALARSATAAMISMCRPRAANCTLPGTTESPIPAGRNAMRINSKPMRTQSTQKRTLTRGA